MGRRLISQRRGRGSPTYRVPEMRLKANIRYMNINGKIVDFVNDPSRNPPLAKILYGNGEKGYLIAPLGARLGDDTSFVSTLSKIPVGANIFSIESCPNSGPKFCRTAGSAAMLVSKASSKCTIQFPSKKKKLLDENCRASVGIPAGGGHHEKPFLKAGKKWIAMHKRGKLYPRTSGVAMNAVDHPFGGPTKPGKPKTVSKHAPPGKKAGAWGARRTGRRRGKK
jgi:large subunit ribosomal protein L2